MLRKNTKFMAFVLIVGSMIFFNQSALCASIEDHYAEKGSFLTSTDKIQGYRIVYPKNMTGNHPIIAWGNGTAAPTLIYQPIFNHLASWGFVVVASNSGMAQSGREMIEGIDYLIEQNNNTSSKFYGMLDVQHIGTTGHSQGGGGAINSATDPRVTCTAPIAPSPGRIGQVNGPVFLIAGETDIIVSPLMIYLNSYVFSTKPTILGVASGMGHFGFLGDMGNARGYLTAWFMHHLQGDDYAAQAFIGECEICDNDKWQVRTKNQL
jgi:dienelactone hydrolase